MAGTWQYVNDGLVGNGAHIGWTTHQNPSVPVVLTADLGSVINITKIKLYPRQNDHAVGRGNSIAANFPAAFTVETATDNRSYTVAYAKAGDGRVPYYGKNFSLDKAVKRARIYASAMGVFTMQLNGHAVTDAVLEPGEK